MFDGSKRQFFAAMLSENSLTKEELKELKELINRME